jgi:splicing factor 3B subunit 3
VNGNRIMVSDIQDSFHFVRYKRHENQLIVFADDTSPRWLTASCILDYYTMAGADKFGNICVVRLPYNVTDDVDEDPTGHKALWDRGSLNGASQKVCFINLSSS